MTTDPVRVAFVCVENAGRSQMAAALAERERDRRGLESVIEIRSGGTDPAKEVHDVVIEAMAEVDLDLADRTPSLISRDEILEMDMVVTMGCSAGDLCPATWRGDARDWGLDDPANKPLDDVKGIRDDIADRIEALFDDLETEATTRG